KGSVLTKGSLEVGVFSGDGSINVIDTKDGKTTHITYTFKPDCTLEHILLHASDSKQSTEGVSLQRNECDEIIQMGLKSCNPSPDQLKKLQWAWDLKITG